MGIHKLIASAALVATSLPIETHQSFPIPAHLADDFVILFLFCPSRVNLAEGLMLKPPDYVVEIVAESAKLKSMRHVTPKDFGQFDPPDEFLGRYDMMPDNRTAEQYHEFHARLLAAFDVLIPAFGDRARRLTSDVQRMARDFTTLFPQVTEQPLQPYYRAIGTDFFSWVGQVAS